MTRIFLIIPLLIALYFGLRWFARAKVDDAKRAIQVVIFTLVLALVLFLVVSGKLSWLFAAAVAAYPIIQRIWSGWRIFRWLKARKQQQNGQDAPAAKPNRGGMSAETAYATLKPKPGASREEVIAAHRTLMSKAHPDRGGSDQQAQQLNAAKAFLIEQMGRHSS
ncbi:MAG: hypothetical protein L3J94_11615 [Gammaproteobacteria bacterium]|nr:hypothetical protein [Gammaproteobacteria bacterium]